MGSREGGTTSSGSSTDSIDGDVLGMHASRSMSSQPEGNIDTITISSDSEPSGNSEPTTQSHVLRCRHTGMPLILESQDIKFIYLLNFHHH